MWSVDPLQPATWNQFYVLGNNLEVKQSHQGMDGGRGRSPAFCLVDGNVVGGAETHHLRTAECKLVQRPESWSDFAFDLRVNFFFFFF